MILCYNKVYTMSCSDSLLFALSLLNSTRITQLKEEKEMLNDERSGFIRLLISGVLLLASLWGLLFFYIPPHLCGSGFIAGSLIGCCGHFRLVPFYPIGEKECRPMVAILTFIDLFLIAGAAFGFLLITDLI